MNLIFIFIVLISSALEIKSDPDDPPNPSDDLETVPIPVQSDVQSEKLILLNLGRSVNSLYRQLNSHPLNSFRNLEERNKTEELLNALNSANEDARNQMRNGQLTPNEELQSLLTRKQHYQTFYEHLHNAIGQAGQRYYEQYRPHVAEVIKETLDLYESLQNVDGREEDERQETKLHVDKANLAAQKLRMAIRNGPFTFERKYQILNRMYEIYNPLKEHIKSLKIYYDQLANLPESEATTSSSQDSDQEQGGSQSGIED